MIKILRRTALFGLITIIIIAALIWFFAGWIVKTGVEQGGTAALGAKVELEDANVNWSPFGIELTQLKVTNPDKPMENMLQIDSAQGEVQFTQLLAAQVIINELTATGVKFNTARSTSGAIQTEEPSSSEQSKLDLNTIKDKLPSFDEIIAKEPLITPEKAEAFKTTAKESQQDINEKIKNLPEAEKIKDYEKRLKAATSGDIGSLEDLKTRKDELSKIKDEIRQDKKNLEAARDSIKTAKQELKTDYSELKTAPKEDMARIRERYSLDAAGASNLTQLLFGDQAKTWFDNLQTWYTRLQEVMPAADEAASEETVNEGDNLFAFVYDKTLPKFLIRHAKLAASIPVGDVDIDINDVTNQPQILGKPLTLKATGEGLPTASSLLIDAVIDHVNPKTPTDKIDWSIKDWQLTDLVLSKKDAMPVTLQKSLTNASGTASIQNKVLEGIFNADFKGVEWQVAEKKGWEGEVAKALKTIEKFNLKGEITGDISSPSFSIASDLDDHIKNVATQQLKTKQAELESKVQSYLNEQVTQVGGPYEDQLAALTNTEGSVTQRIDQLEEMLKAEIQSAVDDKKQQAEDKAKDAVKDKLKQFKF